MTRYLLKGIDMNSKTALKYARKAVVLSADLGAEIAVSSIIRCHVPMHHNRLIRGVQNMGRWSMMGVVGGSAGKYAGRFFDDCMQAFTEIKDDKTPTILKDL